MNNSTAIGKGDWSKLTKHLLDDGGDRIELSDDELREITGSTDCRNPLPLRGDPDYSIVTRAADAGYDVSCHPSNKCIKIFTKRK